MFAREFSVDQTRVLGVVSFALKPGIDVGKVLAHPEKGQRLTGGAEINQPPLGQKGNQVTLTDVGGGVCDQHHRAPGVGVQPQVQHYLLLQAGVQPRGGFVQEK